MQALHRSNTGGVFFAILVFMKENRIHIIVATTLFALLVWFSVSMSYQYQTTVSAPIEVQDLPAGKAIKSKLPKHVQLKFRGDGWRLAALLFGTKLKFAIDLTALPSGQKVITLNDLSERISLPIGVQATDMKPESVYVSLDTYFEKKVPLIPNYTISFREGYAQVGPVVLIPDSVSVGGAESIVRNIGSWALPHHEIDDLRNSVNTTFPLVDTTAYQLSFRPQEVIVRINVQQFAEKVFSGIPVEVTDLPFNREVLLSPPKIEIVVRGGIEQLSDLTSEDFHAVIDYTSILQNKSGTLSPSVESPAGVHIVSKRPDALQYIIRKRL